MANEPFIEALEAEAVDALKEIREYRTYRGNNPDYRNRAKMAIGIIGSYVRLRATMANERSNDLIERRLVGGAGGVTPRAYIGGAAEQ